MLFGAESSQKFPQMWQWNARKEQAAGLVAADDLTNAEIAEKVDITPRALAKWKAAPEFQARVASIVAEFRSRVRVRGIAIVENRVAALDDRWKLMKAVIEERSQDPSVANAAGGGTGLIVKTIKGIGKGDDFQLVECYGVDTGLLSEMRAHELQAAKELGQYAEKQDVTVRDDSIYDTLKRKLAGLAAGNETSGVPIVTDADGTGSAGT